ncbi:hypothetical protein CR513_04086, partial [Mucuna pruriens]
MRRSLERTWYKKPTKKITRTADNNKLTPSWEGPFRVSEEVKKGAYHLEHHDIKKIPRTWNVLNLRLYYS